MYAYGAVLFYQYYSAGTLGEYWALTVRRILGTVRRILGALLGEYWALLGEYWALLGEYWELLGEYWELLGANTGRIQVLGSWV